MTKSKLIHFKYNRMCYLTYPCQHYIEYTTDDNKSYKGLITSIDIYQICVSYNQTIPEHIQNEYNMFKDKHPIGVYICRIYAYFKYIF